MSTALIIWSYLFLGKVVSFLTTAVTIFLALSALTLLMLAIAFIVEAPEPLEMFAKDNFSKVKSIIKKTVIYVAIVIVFCSMYPKKDEVMLIVGGAVAVEGGKWLVSNEEAKEIPNNVMKAVNHFLETVTEEEN